LLGEQVVEHRTELMTQIIRLLLVMVPDQRSHYLKEEPETYDASAE
jgi:hypothetical protein